jgi:hypothetical protein
VIGTLENLRESGMGVDTRTLGTVWMVITAIGCTGPDIALTRHDQDEDGYFEDDCDNNNALTYPGADEICDGEDNDCDGDIDEDLHYPAWADADGDGFGDASAPSTICAETEGWSTDPTDCDDADADRYPTADEVCDGKDNDCDDEIDEGLDLTFYTDGDGDGYGDPEATVVDCALPEGAVENSDDCDDEDPEVSPAGHEVCSDGVDQDCDDQDSICTFDGEFELDRDADLAILGEDDGDLVGHVMGSIDVDGDGRPELLLGAPGDGLTSFEGAAYVVFFSEGVSSGLVQLSSPTSTWYEVRALYGEHKKDQAGHAIDAAGDLDGDGLGDLIIGAPRRDSVSGDAGAAYLQLGANLTLAAQDLEDADMELQGTYGADLAGSAVLGMGDPSGAGFGQVAVSAPMTKNGAVADAGAVYILQTCPEGVGGCVDLEGDGTREVSSSWGPGAVLGLGAADHIFYGGSALDQAGSAMAMVGDFNGDGLDDFGVGAPGKDVDGGGEGAMYLMLSWPYISSELEFGADLIIEGAVAGGGLGAVISSGGDVDGDGLGDVLLGVPAVDGQTGAVYVVHGYGEIGEERVSVVDLSNRITGEAEGEGFGGSVQGAGDVNGDGHADIWIGAAASDEEAPDGGKVYLVVGPVDGVVSPLSTFRGQQGGGRLGTSVAGGFDLNQDGHMDVLLGGTGFNDNGSAFLFFGGID